MTSATHLAPSLGRSQQTSSALPERCRDFLLAAQNPDGGWGYRSGQESSVEATAWALLALAHPAAASAGDPAVEQGTAWLVGTQLRDGSWPAYRGQGEGCWTTSLASLALLQRGRQTGREVARGIAWLCAAWPGDGSPGWRLRHWLFGRPSVIQQNHRLRGWSWTPRTASWVEPTAYALLLLGNCPSEMLPRSAARRQQLGEALLYDRMCPGGGWNCGNPLVYGVPGEPQVGPTVWALLALQAHRQRPENQMSLDWLRCQSGQMQAAGSLALARICLELHGQRLPSLAVRLGRLSAKNQFFQNLLVAAWVALALEESPGWLAGADTRKG